VIKDTQLRSADAKKMPNKPQRKLERASISRGPLMQSYCNSFDHYQ